MGFGRGESSFMRIELDPGSDEQLERLRSDKLYFIVFYCLFFFYSRDAIKTELRHNRISIWGIACRFNWFEFELNRRHDVHQNDSATNRKSIEHEAWAMFASWKPIRIGALLLRMVLKSTGLPLTTSLPAQVINSSKSQTAFNPSEGAKKTTELFSRIFVQFHCFCGFIVELKETENGFCEFVICLAGRSVERRNEHFVGDTHLLWFAFRCFCIEVQCVWA